MCNIAYSKNQQRLHLQFNINCPINEVFNCLCNADNFANVHPLIYKMEAQASGGYMAYEQMKLAFLKIRFTYPCTIESNFENKTINMKALVSKMVHINMVFKLSTQNNSTIIDEYTTFKSLLPVGFILQSIFKKQHQQLFLTIEKRFNKSA